MKLLSFRSGHRVLAGVVVGSDVLDISTARQVTHLALSIPDTLREILAGGEPLVARVQRLVAEIATGTLRDTLRRNGALIPLDDVTLAPVIPDPRIILCGSMNSRAHNEEMSAPTPTVPCAFLKTQSALAGSGDPIVPPAGHSNMLDWEGEFTIVIGKRCHQVPVVEALNYVFGYTLMNDVSARDFVAPFMSAVGPVNSAIAWERNVLGKNFPTFCPVGPSVVSKDEFVDGFRYQMRTLVNGTVMQSSDENDHVFGVAEMVSCYSEFFVLEPGDLISLGSPPGVGMARKPPVFLKPGDLVEVVAPQIGTLSNRIGEVNAP